MKKTFIDDAKKVIGSTPIYVRNKSNLNQEHIASGVIGEEVYQVFHDFNNVYVTFPNRENKDSFEINMINFVESVYFFDSTKRKKRNKE